MRIEIITDLLTRFNQTLEKITKLDGLNHVAYVNLLNSLPSNMGNYKKWWDNEMHPTEDGFEEIAKRFNKAIKKAN